jgi:transaldolase
MIAMDDIVFLFDVDNTLLDNDRIQDDLSAHLATCYSEAVRKRYWSIFEELRGELGYADYLGALERYRSEDVHDPRILKMASWLVDYPFADRLYPGALDAVKRLGRWGRTVVLSDGDAVFQPRKVERAGIWSAFGDRVLIFIHKEQELDDVERLYPGAHYVLIDDKLRILAAVKAKWGDRVTTVFPRQGHCANDPEALAAYAPADIEVERIGDLAAFDRARFGPNKEGVRRMKATEKLHAAGQSLWLDNITRDLLTSGTLKRYIDTLSVTGLTSNPTIFDHAITKSAAYDADIRAMTKSGVSREDLFFKLAIADLQRAADLFRPIHDRTAGVDGWVSLEVSPLLAYDTQRTVEAAKSLHAAAARPNLFIKIPGTKEGAPAIEEAIFGGVPINVTLLFSRDHYLAAAEAYMHGLERRIAAGLSPDVRSVASLFISRWDKATMDKLPANFRDRLGIAVAETTYAAYRDVLDSDRWQRLENSGARPQRLLFASTGTKDPRAPDTLYIGALAAPNSVNTMPEETLLDFADHGEVGGVLRRDGAAASETLSAIAKAGVDLVKLAADLQAEGAKSFDESWSDLLKAIETKSQALSETQKAIQ